jgi:peroxiredoxin/outer membrane lipoprotein-sorting protein
MLSYRCPQFRDRPEYKEQDRTELFERETPNTNDESARRLLKKVSETYSNLATAEFEFEEAGQYTDEATATRSKSISHMWISSSSKWKVATSGSRERVIEIADGKALWTFFPESNQYTVYPAGNLRSPIVDRYRSIDKVHGSGAITGSERLGDFDCTVVKIERPNNVRTLWISTKTNFILKDESTETPPSAPANSTTINSVTTFSVARVLTTVDEQLFSFDPRKLQAKPRDELLQQAPSTSVGTRAPDFALFDLENKPIRLSELKGKVVLLDFWASWCVPCRAELPNVELLHRDFKDKGLIVLGVDDEESNDQAAFLGKFGYTFRSLVDRREQVKNLYKVGGIPTTLLIDREGTIQVFEPGGASYDSLRDAVRKVGIF